MLTGEVKFFDYSELHHLNGEVHRLGNNINQMAKIAHLFSEVSEQEVLNFSYRKNRFEGTQKKLEFAST